MRTSLIIALSVLLSFGVSTDLLSQRASKKGFNYKAHAKSNAKHAKINAKKFKAAGGDLTKMKCGKKRRVKSRSKVRRRVR
ncbi:MAG: hypothetical protein AB8B53_05350 [Flavobacteriales bacterium]